MARRFDNNINNRLQLGTGRPVPITGFPITLFVAFRLDSITNFHSPFSAGASTGSPANSLDCFCTLIRGSGANNTLALYQIRGTVADIFDLTDAPAPTGVWIRMAVARGAANDCVGMVSVGARAFEYQTFTGTITPLPFDNYIVSGRYMAFQNFDGPLDGDVAMAAVWGAKLDANDMLSVVGGGHPLQVAPQDLAAVWDMSAPSNGNENNRIEGEYLSNLGTVPQVPGIPQPLNWPRNVEMGEPPEPPTFNPAWAARSTITIGAGAVQ